MQKWEYITYITSRGTPVFSETRSEAISLHEPWGHFPEEINKLGEKGWELVTAAPVSDHVGTGVAGTTTAIYFVFKRPKQ